MTRQRILQVLVVGAAALTAGAAIGLAAFELQVVRPGLTAIRAALAAGAPAERAPPDALFEMLMRAHHRELAPAAVRLLRVDRQQRHTGLRLATQLGLVVMLPLHLSERELAGFVLAQSHMGLDTPGFAHASLRHLGVPLESVDRLQAAKLVAIAHGPSAYLDNPARLARRMAWLLAADPR